MRLVPRRLLSFRRFLRWHSSSNDLQPERAIIQALIDAHLQTGITQKELSERTGIAQGDISKLERGNSNPSISTLQRLAEGMGMRIQLKFVPERNT